MAVGGAGGSPLGVPIQGELIGATRVTGGGESSSRG
eukprot:COSAG02_NODE_920_length_15934_cov_11.363751_13_plen_35_part_01